MNPAPPVISAFITGSLSLRPSRRSTEQRRSSSERLQDQPQRMTLPDFPRAGQPAIWAHSVPVGCAKGNEKHPCFIRWSGGASTTGIPCAPCRSRRRVSLSSAKRRLFYQHKYPRTKKIAIGKSTAESACRIVHTSLLQASARRRPQYRGPAFMGPSATGFTLRFCRVAGEIQARNRLDFSRAKQVQCLVLGRVILGVHLRSRHLLLFAALLIAGLGASAAQAERAITAFELFDRMRGMWLGQLIGNAAGRATEGLYSNSSPNPGGLGSLADQAGLGCRRRHRRRVPRPAHPLHLRTRLQLRPRSPTTGSST